MRIRVFRLTFTALVVVGGCFATATSFDRYFAQEQWPEAAAAFSADSSLLNNEHALYRAGVVFGTPGLEPYDPSRAHVLLSALLRRFPKTEHRTEATTRLALVDEVLRVRRETGAHQQELEARIAALAVQVRDLSTRLDSATTQRDSLRTAVTRLEADRKDKDELLRALRLELQRLKEIDLKPRTPPPTKIRP